MTDSSSDKSKGPKRAHRNVSADVMAEAVALVLNSNVSLRDAADQFGMKHQTLHDNVQKQRKLPEGEKLKLNHAPQKIFSDEQEEIIATYLKRCSEMAYGLTPGEVRKLVYEIAKANQMKVPPSWHKNKRAGKKWLSAFLKRNSTLSIRKPEACSLSRLTSFNFHNVKKFTDNQAKVFKKYPDLNNPARIYNLDETATTTVQNPKKVVTIKGAKQVYQSTSGERGQLVTTTGIVCASGSFCPPVMIFPRKFFKAHMLANGYPGTKGLANPSGWQTRETFIDVMKHFIQCTGSSKDNRTLLILDNHESHVSLDVIKLADEAGVVLLTLPPHCSNKLQPLDVSVYGPFKSYYNEALSSWMAKNPGVPASIYNIAECVSYACTHSMTPANILSGFRKSGIYPFNPHQFKEEDFAISSVTDRPIDPAGSTSAEAAPGDTAPQENSRNADETVLNKSGFISPEDLIGYPKAAPRKIKRARKRGESVILTEIQNQQSTDDTPDVAIIESKQASNKDRPKRKTAVRIKREFENDDEPAPKKSKRGRKPKNNPDCVPSDDEKEEKRAGKRVQQKGEGNCKK